MTTLASLDGFLAYRGRRADDPFLPDDDRRLFDGLLAVAANFCDDRVIRGGGEGDCTRLRFFGDGKSSVGMVTFNGVCSVFDRERSCRRG